MKFENLFKAAAAVSFLFAVTMAVPAYAESVSDAVLGNDPAVTFSETSESSGTTIRAPQGREDIGQLVARAARSAGVPVALAHAVVRAESNYNPRARGRAGEVGLMQIKPSTARAIGYTGSTSALYDPATNLRWGMKYLAGAHDLAGGDTCGTILRYNAGHYARRMNPISARYCRKVNNFLNQQSRTRTAGI